MSPAIDFSRSEYRNEWLHHCAVGDPSWDTFVREDGNPIYTGREPYSWPVNGFLFHDPPSGRWYAYVGLYPRGYWPGGPCLVMRERAGGGWEEIGLAIQGDPSTFDGDGAHPGAMPDVSVVYADGQYHMVYDWANHANNRGGLAYACADRPEGPFVRADHPLHLDADQRPLLGKYVRAYAATLIKRSHDWIILHAMSTPGNAGGTWAMACMTASNPAGPYSEPGLLLCPQSNVFLPALMEYYPAFAHDGFIYAPATSVARNRSFQCVFRAPIEEAHRPEAWEVYQHGSVWHAENRPSEAQGIWGQTFSAQVSDDGTMRAYFTSKTQDDTGTVHLARRRWAEPYQDGFVISAPNAPAFGILRRHYRTFNLTTQAQSSGAWSLSWGCRSPLGPGTTVADAAPHPLMFPQQITWQRAGERWRLESLDEDGRRDTWTGILPQPANEPDTISITQDEFSVAISLNDQPVCMLAYPASEGRIQLLAEAGTVMRIEQFIVDGETHPCTEDWLAIDALAGSAIAMDGAEWRLEENDAFRYGLGYRSSKAGAEAKWNFHGTGYRLHAVRGPECGEMLVIIDNQAAITVSLSTPEPAKSTVVLSGSLPAGYHAVKVIAQSENARLDTLEVIP